MSSDKPTPSPEPADDAVAFALRIPRSVRSRLVHHAQRLNGGNTSKLAREGLTALVRILDQQEQQ